MSRPGLVAALPLATLVGCAVALVPASVERNALIAIESHEFNNDPVDTAFRFRNKGSDEPAKQYETNTANDTQ
jgi:hypothetical protein